MRVRQRVSSKAMKLPTTIIFLFKHETECHVWTRIDNNRQRTGNTGYPAELFPMEVQVALDHVPTTRKSPAPAAIGSLLLVGLLGGLGGLAGDLLGGGGLDHTDGDGLPHVPDGEPSKGRELGEGLDAHGLAGEQLDDSGVTRLDELRGVLGRLAGTPVHLLQDLCELACNVGGVAIKHWRVAVGNLSGVVEDNDLGSEVGDTGGGLVLGVGGDVSPLDVLHGNVLDVEANVVAGDSLGEGLVVHLDRLDLSGEVDGGESDDHAGLDDSSLNTTNGHCANATNLINILEGQPEGLVGGPAGWDDRVESLKQSHTVGLALLSLHVPALVPAHVGRGLNHVVAVPSGDGDEGHSSGVIADLLDESGHLLLDLLKPSLGVGWLGGVHLVDSHDELLDTQGVCKEGVLPGLTILGDTCLELSGSRGNDQDSTIGLAGSSDHVLDEVTMTGGVDDGDVVLGSLELPEGNINGDATLTLGLQLVHHPRILEGTLARLLGLLLELLNCPLVDSTALVDQMAGGGGLARVHVADDHDVDVDLLLSHPGYLDNQPLVEVNQAIKAW